jgi:cyclopropane fatty-acyl-phospholipid synthase-like methyltransferase
MQKRYNTGENGAKLYTIGVSVTTSQNKIVRKLAQEQKVSPSLVIYLALRQVTNNFSDFVSIENAISELKQQKG